MAEHKPAFGSIKLSKRSSLPGAGVKIRGSVPGPSGRPIKLQRATTENRWETVASDTSGRRGKFAFVAAVPADSYATVAFRVSAPAVRGAKSGTTAAARLKVSEPVTNPRRLPMTAGDGLVTVGDRAYSTGGSQLVEYSAATDQVRVVTQPLGDMRVLLAANGLVYFSVTTGQPAQIGSWVYDVASGTSRKYSESITNGAVRVGSEVVLSRAFGGFLRTDGTTAGTRDLGSPGAPFAGGQNAITWGSDSVYAYDGAGSVVQLVTRPDTYFSSGVRFGDRYLFASYGETDASKGLWVTNGTPAGTSLLVPGTFVSWFISDGLVYFGACIAGACGMFATDGLTVSPVTTPGSPGTPMPGVPPVRVGGELLTAIGNGTDEAPRNYLITPGATSARPTASPYILAPSSPAVAIGTKVLTSVIDYDGFRADITQSMYVYDTSAPVVKSNSAIRIHDAKLKAPLRGRIHLLVEPVGHFHIGTGAVVVVRRGSKVIASAVIGGRLKAAINVPGRKIGRGTKVLGVQFLGTNKLDPSPVLPLTVTIS